jgi:uncharacterized protein (TIGR03083 family)
MEAGMNDIEVAALVDTTRDELRERIAQALQRFDRLARSADPLAPPPRSNWTVQQVVSHVLTIACRYLQYVEGGYRLAAHPREVSVLNQTELDAAMAPIPQLVDELQTVAPQLNELFDKVADEARVLAFHCGAVVDGITWQTNWLGELLMHGQDIARAVKAPWMLAERDMLLIARGLMQIAPAYVRPEILPDTGICVAVLIPQAHPYLIHIHDGVAEVRGRRPNDRPDAVLRLPASTMTQMLYQRIGPVAAALKGLRVVGGRRPWLALKLQSCFEPA